MFNGGSAAPLQSAYDSRSFCRETSYYSEKRVLFKLIAQKVKNALSSRDLHRNGSFYTLQHILGQVESMHTLICFSSGI